MGCSSCGKRAQSSTVYRVTLPGKGDQTFDTVAEAQQAIRAAGNPQGAAFRAVPR